MHHHFATVYSSITRFSPKCSEEITVYRSMQNLYHLVIWEAAGIRYMLWATSSI